MRKLLQFALAIALGAALGTGIDQAYSSVVTTQAANPINNIVGGSINNTPIGATTPSTGAFTTLSTTGALTYGGVTLTNGVTGTGSMVLSASPTFTGTALGANMTLSGTGRSAILKSDNWVEAAGANNNNTASLAKLSVESANVSQLSCWGSAAGTACTFNIKTKSSDSSIDVTNLALTSTGTAVKGTTTNDSASAGIVGEYQEVNCGIPAASGASVAFTNASPTVGTWTAHPFQKTGVAFGSYACPFTITATAPTGLSTATNYWATPIDANTFHVSTSAANAAAGTWANTSGSTAASNLTNSIALSTTAGLSPAVLLLTAGDWDCSGQAVRVLGATTSVTNMQTGINSSSTAIGSFGTYFDFETAANIMTATSNPVHSTPTVRLSLASTTAEYLVAVDTFTVSTNTVSGFLRCRRMR